jgi:PAS domain S-box-containing protein
MRLRNLWPKTGLFDVLGLGLVIAASLGFLLAERLLGRELALLPAIVALAALAFVMFARLVAWIGESARLRNEIGDQYERLAEAAAIVESTDDSVTVVTLDGTILSWNRSSERLYGYTAAEMIGQRIHKIIEPERHADIDATLAAIARGELVEPHEATGVRKDGSIMPVALTVSLVRGADGIVRGISTIARDISDRRAAEAERDALLRELAEQNERLRELDQMKDDFVASVSHELRTPLTSIRGYLELVREDGRLDEEQDRMLGIVDRNADRLLALVTDLLFIAEVHAGKLAMDRVSVQLAHVAAESVEAAAPRARELEIELHLDADPGLAVDGDRTRLAQVLDNLISNAIKFTPAGGRVDVRIFRSDGSAVVEVSDTGPGIPENDRPHLFERFYRTNGAVRAAVQGTGLGLAIVGAIASSHGGTVSVESSDSGGARFRVCVPLAAADIVAQ